MVLKFEAEDNFLNFPLVKAIENCFGEGWRAGRAVRAKFSFTL
jgi:hypothetical protein